MLKTVTSANFEIEVTQASQLVLVDYWSPTCGPCDIYNTVLQQFLAEVKNLKIVKINVDEEIALANQQQILVMPTTQVFYKGKCIKTILGVQSRQDLTNLLQNLRLS